MTGVQTCALPILVDAVDTVTAKIEIIMRAKAADVPVISCIDRKSVV